MPNTTVTIKYSNGSTREFIASDEIEKSIYKGEMFSVTTVHPSFGEEMNVSKMYVGNPISALGNMMMMKRNAEKIMKDDTGDRHALDVVIDILTACISLMSNEITSHQSGMSPVDERDSETTI